MEQKSNHSDDETEKGTVRDEVSVSLRECIFSQFCIALFFSHLNCSETGTLS